MTEEQVSEEEPQESETEVTATVEESPEKKDRKKRRRWTRREKGFGIIAGCLLLIAIAGSSFYFLNQVPAGSAAKVNGFYISEADVSAYVTAYRASMKATDDATYATLLSESSLNPATFREQVINQLAVSGLIDHKAAELGVTPSDSDVQAQVDAMKQGLGLNDDSIFNETLAQNGTSYDQVWAQAKTKLAQQAIYKKDVPTPTPTDSQVKSYIKSEKAGTTIRHSYRITFTGDDKQTKAKKCMARIKAAGKELTTDAFSGFAMSYSSDSNVSSDGGAYGWSDATDLSDDYKGALDALKEGQYSEPTSVNSSGEIDIIYCDTVYTFPKKSQVKKMDLSKLPTSLQTYLSDSEADVLWQADCKTYLSNMLEAAQITYYPMPDDASYNVDMSKAKSTSASSSGSAGSSVSE